MIHKPIQFYHLCLSFPHKVCFENFTTQVHYGSRIAIIGRNGSGKSTLLNLILGRIPRPEREIIVPDDVIFGYVPQLMAIQEPLSGSEHLNKALTQALAVNPNVLLLDEPTNHLDRGNRKSLLRMLGNFPGTLILVSHDMELLTSCIDTLWHIDQGQIRIFHGHYLDYQREYQQRRAALEHELKLLHRERKEAHRSLMQEQERAKKSHVIGEKHIVQRKWPTIVSREKARRAVETSGRKKSVIRHKKQEIMNQLASLPILEVIQPKFSLPSSTHVNSTVLSIRDGTVGYSQHLLGNIHFSLLGNERIAILGENGSGKSTLIKGILNDSSVIKTGEWIVPKPEEVGYLDQHYVPLDSHETVLGALQSIVPHWTHAELRRHLNDFLFFKNEEVNAPIVTLSGGERARLSLAQIAAQTPKLLLLDEITNNLDLETRAHVIQVLKDYPGSLIVISHDEDFLTSIQITQTININQFLMTRN
jgi:ATPase subunit of ABC transporter with duplicated ATPase domains